MRFLADIIIPGHQFGITSERSEAAEAFVLMTVGFLVFLFIGFAIGGYVLWRRERHPSPESQLLMELEDEEDAERLAAGETKDPKPDPKPWEREADWWKK